VFDGQPYSSQPGTVPFLPQKITDAPIDTCVGLRTFLVWGEDIDYATYPKYCGISQIDKILEVISPRNCLFFTYELDELEQYGEILIPF
jgi:hypothetical protein